MFCKWCGGNLASSDTRCNRCGREVSALSDCGGFYDLVPDAKKIVNAQPSLAPQPVPAPKPLASPNPSAAPNHSAAPKPAAAYQPVPQYTKKSSSSGPIALMVSLLVIVLLIVGIVLLGIKFIKVNKSYNEINEKYEAAIDEKSKTRTVVIASRDHQEFVIDNVYFDLLKDYKKIEWQYRFGGNSIWWNLPDEAYTVNSGDAILTVKDSWLQEGLSENKASELELRCIIYRENNDGSVEMIRVEGIKFSFDVKTEDIIEEQSTETQSTEDQLTEDQTTETQAAEEQTTETQPAESQNQTTDTQSTESQTTQSQTTETQKGI